MAANRSIQVSGSQLPIDSMRRNILVSLYEAAIEGQSIGAARVFLATTDPKAEKKNLWEEMQELDATTLFTAEDFRSAAAASPHPRARNEPPRSNTTTVETRREIIRTDAEFEEQVQAQIELDPTATKDQILLRVFDAHP